MDISPKQLLAAIEQVAYEKKIPQERILETVEAALAAAYRKDFGHPEQQVHAKLNPDSAKTEISVAYNIVDEVENPHIEITVADAKKKGMKTPKVGDEYVEHVSPPDDYGRIAAQTAKQVIIQRIREVEREIVQEEFSDRVGELMTGAVQRVEGRNVFVEIGRAIGVMGPEDQIDNERYYIGQRLRVLLRDVDSEARSAQLILTRAHPDFVRHLFELEVPEIHAGAVEIRSVAREAGVRTKVAVHSNQEGVDPVGTCVGQRGTRVQAIMAELGDEKIDIVLYAEDVKTYIANALSPAKISRIDLHEDAKTADIIVSDDQLSLAIGRGGQNVRLAGDLTGWQLDIAKTDLDKGEAVVSGIPIGEVAGIEAPEAKALSAAGLATAQQVAASSDEELAAVEAVTEDRRNVIREAAAEAVSSSGDEPAPEPAEPKASPKKKAAKDENDLKDADKPESTPEPEATEQTEQDDSAEAVPGTPDADAVKTEAKSEEPAKTSEPERAANDQETAADPETDQSAAVSQSNEGASDPGEQ